VWERKYLTSLRNADGQLAGYNIDPNQIESAIDWAAECGMSDRLRFKVGNHHEPLAYESGTFDGCFSFQAVWSFFKEEELDGPRCGDASRVEARRALCVFRVSADAALRLGQRRACARAKAYLPTLAATHSIYPADVCAALKRGGLEIVLSAPSKRPA
jgi:sterol 24-C-methyltransferase